MRGSTNVSTKPPIHKLLEHYGSRPIQEGFHWKPIPCPFHEDRMASASVNTEKGLFKCFAGCDFSGDAYDLVIWKGDASDFLGAAAFIEETLGGSYLRVPSGANGGARGRGRPDVLDESGAVEGQRSLLSDWGSD